MSEPSPSWLTQPSPASPPAPAPVDSLATPDYSNNTASPEEDDPQLPSIILTMRLANMGAAAGLIIVSVFGLLDFPGASVRDSILNQSQLCSSLLTL